MPHTQHNLDSLRVLSQIFSPANFNSVVRKNDESYTVKKIKTHFENSLQHAASKKIVLKSLYQTLQQHYKNEYVFKNILLNKVIEDHGAADVTVLDEFKVGNSIADFVLLNGEAQIFEIKTDLDGLEKLNKQVLDYTQFADKVYVVSSEKHVNKLIELYFDSTIGIIELNERNVLREVKPAKNNSKNFNHVTIFKTLRTQEYLRIVNQFFGYVPQVPNTKIFRSCLSMIEKLDVNLFQKAAFKRLKERKLKCPDLLASSKTPNELRQICHTLDLTAFEYDILYRFLKQPI